MPRGQDPQQAYAGRQETSRLPNLPMSTKL